MTRTLGINATDPGNPSVAGTVASLAQPPIPRVGPGGRIATIPDESGYTPEQKYLLWKAQHGGLGADELSKDVDTFATPLVGAGMTPGAIRARSTTPLSPGQVINTSGQPGGPTIGGGSSYVHAGDEAAGTADLGQANADLETGNAARANLGKIDPIIDLYKDVIAPGMANPGTKLVGDLKTKAVTALGLSPETYLDSTAAKKLIKSQLLTFVGGLRDSAGAPFSPRQTQLIIDQIPDPETDPNGFLSSMAWVRAHLQAQTANADAAQRFIETRTTDPNAGPSYRAQRGRNAGAEGDAVRASGLKGVEGGGGEGSVRAPTKPELDEFNARVGRGEDARKLIRNARAAGVDMTQEPK